ncbi:MAG: methyltransferase domain-containing protein [Methanobacteriota archaeon]|nr:MAG: methyltransferase domain-containing protein [Euryarchaeota archaeon]
MPASFDRIADRYDETRALDESVLQRIAEELERELTTSSRILETGVGTGRIAAPLQRCGFDIVGLDISRKMLSRAIEKDVSTVLLADITALPFMDDSFDHVLSVHVTHLIGDWIAALQEMSRVASNRFVAVVSDREGCDVRAMGRVYEDRCAEMGFEVAHPGIEEQDIADVAAPFRTVHVADVEDGMSSAEAIERYRSRTYSDQWNVPDDVHEYAVDGLLELFEHGSDLKRREQISMMVWHVEDIRKGLLELRR